MQQSESSRRFRRNSFKMSAALVGLMVALGGAAMAAGGDRHAKIFNRLDTNGDDKVSPTEFRPFADRRFVRFDADGDGTVTSEEVKAHLMQRVERQHKRLMRRFDTDGDGKVTQAEYGERVATMFDLIDKNDDGAISREEAQKMRKRMHMRMKRFLEDNAPDGTTEPEEAN